MYIHKYVAINLQDVPRLLHIDKSFLSLCRIMDMQLSNLFKKKIPPFQFGINAILKLVFVWAFVAILIHQVNNKGNLQEMLAEFQIQYHKSSILLLISVMALAIPNWLLEAHKWKILVQVSYPITLMNAFKAVLCGVTVGLITPHRIGEYAGRILTLPAEENARGLMATLVAGLSQNIMNIAFGYVAAVSFAYLFLLENSGQGMILILSSFGFGVTGCGVLIYFYHNLHLLRSLWAYFHKFKYFQPISRSLRMIRSYDSAILHRINGLSLLRYSVYLGQYVLMLLYFGIEAPLYGMVLGASTIFLIQSSLPLPPLLGIFARGEIALLVWGVFSTNALSILSVTFGIWIINLIFPSLVGLCILLNINILKSFGIKTSP